MKRLLVLLSAVVAPYAFAGTTLRLGPEVPLSGFTIGPAPFDQTSAVIAPSGDGYIAAWIDGRQERPFVYTTRLDESGAPLEPFGHAIAPSYGPVGVAEGMVVYKVPEGVAVQPLDAQGRKQGDARIIEGVIDPVEFVANGSTFLLVTNDWYGVNTVVLLDGDGNVIDRHGLHFIVARGGARSAGDGFQLIGLDLGGCPDSSCTSPLTIVTLSRTGESTALAVSRPLSTYWGLSVAFAEDEWIAIWTRDGANMVPPIGAFEIFGYDGASRTGMVTIPSMLRGALSVTHTPEHRFLCAVAGTLNFAIRIREDGSFADPSFFRISNGPAERPKFASTTARTIALWSETRFKTADIFASDVSVLAPDAGAVVSLSAPAQLKVSLTDSFAAWHELGRDSLIVTSAGSVAGETRVDSQGPAVASGAPANLVAWADPAGNILARTAVDEVLVAPPKAMFDYPRELSAAFDDSQFFIAWSEVSVFGRRVSETGSPLSDISVLVESKSQSDVIEHPQLDVAPGKLALAASGRVFMFDDYGPPRSRIWTGFHSPQGTSATVTFFDPIANGLTDRYGLTSIAQATNGDRVAVIWSDYRDVTADGAIPCISVIETVNGQTMPPRDLRCSAREPLPQPGERPRQLDIAWTGTEYILVWTEAGRAYAMRYDAGVNALDSNPLLIANDVVAEPIRIVANAGGAKVAYSRIDATAGDVPRAFVRFLITADATPQRRRGVRP